MPRSTIALLRTSPGAVVQDYRRLLGLLGANTPAAIDTAVALGHAGPALPGERAEPWQLDATLRWLADRGPLPPVMLPSDNPADALAGVARAAGAPRAISAGEQALLLCGASQATLLVERALAGARPALCVVDAVTVRGAPGDAAPLVTRGALLASDDPVALAALLARLTGRDPLRDVASIERAHRQGLGCADLAAVDIVGDRAIADERWAQPAAPRRAWLDRLLDDLSPIMGLGGPPDLRAYEDWVFYTSWGRLYRDYQRRALASSAETLTHAGAP